MRKLPLTEQPQEVCELNRDSPFYPGLVFFAPLSGADPGRDLTTGQRATRTGSRIILQNRLGAFESFSVGNYLDFPKKPNGVGPTTPVTISWTQDARAVNGNSTLLCLQVGTPGIDPQFAIYQSSDSEFYYFTAGPRIASGANSWSTATGALTNNKIDVFTLTASAGLTSATGSNWVLYRNGVLVARDTSNQTFGFVADDTFRIGELAEGGQPFEGIIGHVAIWLGVHTAEQAMAWYDGGMWGLLENPYAERLGSNASGIAFDAASNSGIQTGVFEFTFNRTVSGTDRFLVVDVIVIKNVSLPSVVSVTDDDGGANVAMSLVGNAINIPNYRISSWGLVAPTTGTKTIRVVLSDFNGESVGLAVSYNGVSQSNPTGVWVSGEANNIGTADVTLGVPTIDANDWVHSLIGISDAAIAAGQTSRNNVAGIWFSAVNEDSGPIVTPGVTTMSFSGIADGAEWVIGGYALRPVGVPASPFVDRSLAYSVRNAAQQDRSLAYSLRNAALQDAALVWAVNTSAQQDRSLAYSVRNAAQQDAPLSYQVINAVQRDAPLGYAIKGAAQQDAALAWAVKGSAQQDAALAYQVINAVQRDGGLAYQVANAVQRDAGLAWTVASVTSVEHDAALAWSVLSASQVMADQTLAYAVIGSVSSDAGLGYGVRGAAQQDAGLAWGMLSTVQSDASLVYTLQGGVSADLGLGWSTLGPVEADRALAWSVLEQATVTSDQALAWAVLGVIEDTEIIVVTLQPLIEFRPSVGTALVPLEVLIRPAQTLRGSTGAVPQ